MKRILLALLLAMFSAVHAADKKPNVVLILINDFGYECVAANGGESYKTPVMERLAATAGRFEKFDGNHDSIITREECMKGVKK